MRLASIGAIGLALTGCFYTEPINQRPSIAIHLESSPIPHRGDFVTLTAESADPDDDAVELSWYAYMCSAEGCDAEALETGIQTKFSYKIPPVRSEATPTTKPVEMMHIVLQAKDEFGAKARPDQELDIPVDNYGPELVVSADSKYGTSGNFVDGIPVDVLAKVSDLDDGPGNVTLSYEIFTPLEAATYTQELSELAPEDQLHRTEKLALVPHGLGQWDVMITATDRLGATAEATATFNLVPDHDPCIAAYQPIAPLDGTTSRPLDARTLFQIPVVSDDLDIFPGVAGDDVFGEPTFEWSILDPGATTYRALATTSNGVELDPKQFHANDHVSLRVEIYDRKHTALTCDATALQCSTTTSTCNQRLTWKLVVQ